MPRYVILEHTHPALHWDLMLECGDTLRSWRLAAPPAPTTAVAAEANVDHRLAYLDYEGPVSGGRGVVTSWDAGDFIWLRRDAGLAEVQLHGQRLQGVLTLRQLSQGHWSALFMALGRHG